MTDTKLQLSKEQHEKLYNANQSLRQAMLDYSILFDELVNEDERISQLLEEIGEYLSKAEDTAFNI